MNFVWRQSSYVFLAHSFGCALFNYFKIEGGVFVKKKFRKSTAVLLAIVMVMFFAIEMVGCDNSTVKDNKSSYSSESGFKSDSTVETTNRYTSEQNTEESNINTEDSSFSISDGPIFLKCDEYPSSRNIKSITLTMYSLKDGKQYPIFSYSGDDEYGIDWVYEKPSYSRYLKNEMYFYKVFDPKLEKMAVKWYDDKDGSKHVGWIDKSGTVTDVTNTVHPASSDFSSVFPKDEKPHFKKDGTFVFYDNNEKQYYYYDPVANNIIKKNNSDEEAYDLYGQYRGSVNLNGACFAVSENTQDYVKYDDGYVLFHLKYTDANHNRLVASGVGISDLTEPGKYDYIETPYYSYKTDEGAQVITPESEYRIENMAYCNDTIVFTAFKGSEHAMFKMSYVDRVAGKPERIRDIESSWGNIVMWKS